MSAFKRKKKKRDQSIIFQEFMAFLNNYIRQCVYQMIDEVFKDFQIDDRTYNIKL